MASALNDKCNERRREAEAAFAPPPRSAAEMDAFDETAPEVTAPLFRERIGALLERQHHSLLM